MKRKYIFTTAALLVIAAVAAGCRAIDDEPSAAVNADVPMSSLTAMEKLTESLAEKDRYRNFPSSSSRSVGN